jgi:hypothetical protein
VIVDDHPFPIATGALEEPHQTRVEPFQVPGFVESGGYD